MRRVRLHAGGKRHQFEMTVCDVVIKLSSQSSAAVAVDNVAFSWVRGQRKTATKRARVVERLDQTSGELSRTAAVAAELSLPCTLFRRGGGDDGRWEPKLSYLQVGDADAEEADEALLCAVPLELSAYAASMHAPTRRTHVTLQLSEGMGSLSLTVGSRLLSGGSGGDDGMSNAGSEVSNVQGGTTTAQQAVLNALSLKPNAPDAGFIFMRDPLGTNRHRSHA